MIRLIKLLDVIVMTMLVYVGFGYAVSVVAPTPRWDSEIAGLVAGGFGGAMAARKFPKRDED
jgi:hypothetical protein